MRYGDIYWAKPDPAVGSERAGRRPVIPGVVTVLPLTTQNREWVTRVPVRGSETGLKDPSWAICEQVRTVSTERIGKRLGVADHRTLTEVKKVLLYLLNLQ